MWLLKHPVRDGDPEQSEAHDEQAGHRAAAEGQLERRVQPVGGRLRGPDVRPNRDVHPHVTGQRRAAGADDIQDAGLPVDGERDHEREHDPDYRDHAVLTVEVGCGALLDGTGNPGHGFVPRVRRQHPARQQGTVTQRDEGCEADQGQDSRGRGVIDGDRRDEQVQRLPTLVWANQKTPAVLYRSTDYGLGRPKSARTWSRIHFGGGMPPGRR